MRKRIMAFILSTACVASLGIGSSAPVSAKSTAKTTINFWYMWTGTDAKALTNIISDYNKSQNTYVVKGLSVPDEQKIKASIASGNGPDVTDSFSSNIAAYASKGILQPLDSYIKKDNFTKDFVKSAMNTVKYNNKVWALPTGAGEGMMMFYNKTLLKAAGYSNPPKTFSQMCAVADKTTKIDNKGNMTVMGFPDFPFVYYTDNIADALGGSLISSNGKTLTPNNAQYIQALQAIANWRKKFGVSKVERFESANGAYVSAQDPFIQGHQALRIDGTWLVGDIKQYNPKLSYGIAMLPYPDGKPQLAGGGETSTSILYIPASSKQKTGAWSFMEYIEGPKGMKTFASENGFIPARKALWSDPKIKNLPGFTEFSSKVSKGTMKAFPSFPNQDQYITTLSTYFGKAANGTMTPKSAMNECKQKCSGLLTGE